MRVCAYIVYLLILIDGINKKIIKLKNLIRHSLSSKSDLDFKMI